MQRCMRQAALFASKRPLSVQASAALESLPPPAHFQAAAIIRSASEQARLHALSLRDPAAFWGPIAETFSWRKRWNSVLGGTGFAGDHAVTWFEGAELNITENALDRHVAAGHGSQPAITWESDDGSSTTFTYKQVRRGAWGALVPWHHLAPLHHPPHHLPPHNARCWTRQTQWPACSLLRVRPRATL